MVGGGGGGRERGGRGVTVKFVDIERLTNNQNPGFIIIIS